MNTLVAVCIAPSGTGDEYAPYVAEVVPEVPYVLYVYGNRRRMG